MVYFTDGYFFKIQLDCQPNRTQSLFNLLIKFHKVHKSKLSGYDIALWNGNNVNGTDLRVLSF